MKKNIIIGVLAVLLIVMSTITFLSLTGRLTLTNNDNEEIKENTENNINENDNNVKIPTNEEIKEIFDFVYNYFEMPSVYCGKRDNKITEIYGTERYTSTEFTTYEEMLNSVKKYMTTDVIASKYAFAATTKEYYLEKDGNLYCDNTNKGYIYKQGNIDIKITNNIQNRITFIGTMELIDIDNDTTYDKIDVTLENINNNWLVTSYEKQN